MATSESRSRVGQTLKGKYVLEQLLGEGAMAQVYRAHNQLLGRTVAIKCLHPNLVGDREIVGRFLREARAANSVRHRNIVDVFDIDTDERGVPFIVVEYLEGQDLGRQLDSAAWRLGPEEALDFFIPIADAVAVAHAKGIVHRDLKPDNIFLAVIDGEVVPKVLDFGISKVPDAMRMMTDTRRTAGSSPMGTPMYMSPEQIRDASSVDARGDVWSLGVMLYEALCGEMPFDAEDVGELFQRINTQAPQSLKRVAPYVPASLAQVVHRCLQPDPAARYPDGSALADALRQVRAILGGTASAPPPGPPLPVAPPRPPSQPPPGVAPLGDLSDTLTSEGGGQVSAAVAVAEAAAQPTAASHEGAAAAALGSLRPPSEPPSFEASAAREIERAITAALSRKGIGGTVVVRDNSAELHGVGDSTVAIDLGEWVNQWNLLPADMCDRRAEHAALRLSTALGKTEQSSATDRRAARARLMKAVTYLLVLGGIAAVAGWFWSKGFFGGGSAASDPAPSESSAPPPPETSAGAAARTARACEAARQRLYAGAAMGMDVAGWVVEIWLAGKKGKTPLSEHAELKKLIAAGAVAELGAVGASKLQLRDGAAPELAQMSSVIVQLDGGYATSFFQSEGRERFIDFAARTADSVGAEHAALFARCAHLSTRDVGAWYRGPTVTAATATLLYSAGAFVEPPAFDKTKVVGDDILGALSAALDKVGGDAVEQAVRTSGGRAEESKPGGAKAGTSIHFPLGGPTRASKVSRVLAGLAGL